MTDWIEHNGGPQPVGDDVWVEVFYLGAPARRIVRAGNHMSLVWKGERFKWRVLNQNTMTSLIDAARLEGIRLGLEAANKAIEALVSTGDLHIEEEMALEEASIAICTLNSEAIAKETAR